MNIISVIDSRIKPDSIETKFSVLAHEIIKDSAAHQKRVQKILPEFDMHDGTHSNAVEENMARLIGEERLKSLSSSELFVLCMAAHLHDVGMAPTDWELETMFLTEGSENFYERNNSIKWDGKKPYSFNEAKALIEARRNDIYDFDSLRQNKFAPNNEDEFIDSLVRLFIEYQEFRNGYADLLHEVKNSEEFISLNGDIRQEYVRKNHHLKSAEYIRNLGAEFERQLGRALPRNLANDIASICQAHCEDPGFTKQLKTDVSYFNDDSVNLQFVAEILRLGDIVHFCIDRAPAALLSSTKFKSDYSRRQWKVKADTGLNYSIKNGIISYRAFCRMPEDFYQLQEYCDQIDDEILQFNTLKRSWDERYHFDITLNRKDIDYDHDTFRPVIGKKITLNQKNIIELLMGVQLYKDPFACLRELYQNSLDACRCRIDIAKANDTQMRGRIEFGLGHSKNSEKYIYCLDNGIGMTEDIIENYLLKIGNSYYKSKEFYRNQSKWNSKFTPVSQFGIGILSCFMLASKVEIVTRHIDGTEVLACCIDGEKEHFYYKAPDLSDKEHIKGSGTLVKLYLKPGYADKVNDQPLEKFGLIRAFRKKITESYDNRYDSYKKYYEDSAYHLYIIIDTFIRKIPEGIDVNVKFSDNKKQPIINKPFIPKYGAGMMDLSEEDKSLICRYSNAFDGRNLLVVNAALPDDGVECDFILSMTSDNDRLVDEIEPFRDFNGVSAVSIDGIYVPYSEFIQKKFDTVLEIGQVNFYGSNPPKLSVDRTAIVSYSGNLENVSSKLLLEVFRQTIIHTEEYLKGKSREYRNAAWQQIVETLCRISKHQRYEQNPLLIKLLSDPQYGNFVFQPLCDLTGCEDTSISVFLSSQNMEWKNYDYRKVENHSLINYIIDELSKSIKTARFTENGHIVIEKKTEPDKYAHSLTVREFDIFYTEYDVVDKYYPFLPERVCGLNIDYSHIMFLHKFDSHCFAIHYGLEMERMERTWERVMDSRMERERGWMCETEIEREKKWVWRWWRNMERNGRISHRMYVDNNVKITIICFMLIDNCSVVYLLGGRYMPYKFPRRHTRKEMLEKLPESFWSRHAHELLCLLDGRTVRKEGNDIIFEQLFEPES